MRFFGDDPIAPRHAAASILREVGHDAPRRCCATVAMDFERFRFEAADNNFLRRCFSPMADVNSADGKWTFRSNEMPSNPFARPRAFDAQRSHGAASFRGQQYHAIWRKLVHSFGRRFSNKHTKCEALARTSSVAMPLRLRFRLVYYARRAMAIPLRTRCGSIRTGFDSARARYGPAPPVRNNSGGGE